MSAEWQGYIFDLDGVLVDSYDCWWHLLQDAQARLGRPPISTELFHKSWGQGPQEDRKMFFPGFSLEQVFDYYDQNFEHFTQWAKVEPGATEVLKQLKARKKKIAVASNSTRKIVEALLHQIKGIPYVDVVVGVDEVAEGKPAPDLVVTAIRRLKLERQECCYTGDSIFDEQAARAADVHFIGYKRAGDTSIDHLSELIG